MAGIVIKEQDNSMSMAGTPDMIGGMVIVADRGRVDKPVLVDKNTLISKYGKPNPQKSTTHYSAMWVLEKASQMYVARVIHNAVGTETESNRTARFASALIKGKIATIPEGIPDITYSPERIIEPYLAQDGFGLTQKDIDSFSFPVYSRERVYQKLKAKIAVATENSPIIVVNDFTGLDIGNKISFGDNGEVNDDSPVFEVLKAEEVEVKYPQLKINSTKINVVKGDMIRRVLINKKETELKLTAQVQEGAYTLPLTATTDLVSGQTITIGNSPAQYVIQSIGTNEVTLRTPVKGGNNTDDKITIMERTYEAVEGNPKVVRDSKGSDSILLDGTDNILNDGTYTFMTGITNAETEFGILKKTVYNEVQKQVTLDKATTTETGTILQLMKASEFEQRDVGLLYADNQGSWASEKVTIAISASADYPDKCRIIRVLYDGVDTGEKFEVAFEYFVDGLGKQLYVEDVINGNSEYIRFKHNKECVDMDGKPMLPLVNNYCLWQENPTDIFKDTEILVKEDLNYGDTDIVISDNTKLELGDRIKFGNFSQEYKVAGKSTNTVQDGDQTKTEYHITIDRAIQVDTIDFNSKVYKFETQELKRISKISTAYYDKELNSQFAISGVNGKLLDCGGNLITGGHNGSIPDIGDMIQTLNKCFSNREEINVNFILDGGVYAPAYQQRIVTLCENRETTIAFLSCDPSALDSTDACQAVIADRQSKGINSSYAKISPDWVYVYDEYNKRNVLISNDGMMAALQSYNANGGMWAVPSAGWSNGKLFNVVEPKKIWTEAERDMLLDAQLNPVKVLKSKGMCMWGDKTATTTRSYLQLGYVRFLLVQTNMMLRERLESEHWMITDSSKRASLCEEIKDSLWNKFSSVLNDLQCYDTTTTQDEDAQEMKLFIGIQPKSVVENIRVTLGIFSNSKTIEVA